MNEHLLHVYLDEKAIIGQDWDNKQKSSRSLLQVIFYSDIDLDDWDVLLCTSRICLEFIMDYASGETKI